MMLIIINTCYKMQIILTHEHADAVLGLDDIRSVQPFSPVNDIEPTPIFLNQHAMERYSSSWFFFICWHFNTHVMVAWSVNLSHVLNSLKVKFPYLLQRKLKAGEEVRRVAQLEWKIIENDSKKPFVASGLEITPFPVNILTFSFIYLLFSAWINNIL